MTPCGMLMNSPHTGFNFDPIVDRFAQLLLASDIAFRG
jgi:hypothetical protein